GPAERRSASDDSPEERRQPERKQEEEHHPCAENAFLVRSPSVLQQGATATERLQGPDALDDHGREDEQGRDGPSGPEDPANDSTARLVSDCGKPEEQADGRGAHGPDEDLEETRIRSFDP